MSRMTPIRMSFVKTLLVLLASLLLAKCASSQEPSMSSGGPVPSPVSGEAAMPTKPIEISTENSTGYTNLMYYTFDNMTHSSLNTSETVVNTQPSTLKIGTVSPVSMSTTKSNVTETSSQKIMSIGTNTTPSLVDTNTIVSSRKPNISNSSLSSTEATTNASSVASHQTTQHVSAISNATTKPSLMVTTAPIVIVSTQGSLTSAPENSTTMSSISSTGNYSEYNSTTTENPSPSRGKSIQANAATACGFLLALLTLAVA